MNVKKYVGSFINSWEIGQGKVFGRINGAISFSLMLSTWLIVSNFDVPAYFLVVFICLVACFFVISGFIYIKLGLYQAEIKNYNRINPFQREVLERLDKIEKGLK